MLTRFALLAMLLRCCRLLRGASRYDALIGALLSLIHAADAAAFISPRAAAALILLPPPVHVHVTTDLLRLMLMPPYALCRHDYFYAADISLSLPYCHIRQR